MAELEICLIVIGIICVACSFLFSEHLAAQEMKEDMIGGVNVASVTGEIVKREVEAEVANVIDSKIEEMEVRLDKLTTEKIMAMGEYSEDIQDKISQNHDEVMFLYNMLNDKEDVLKNTVRDIEALKVSVKKMAERNEMINDTAKDESEEATKVNVVEDVKGAVKGNSKAAKKGVSKTSDKKGSAEKKDMNNNQVILDLYAKGKSSVEIAQELGLGVGEVKLVIGLFNSK